MIKETVDAVRLAELEGAKVISTAKVNGQDMKNQIKIQGAEYRTERLKEAKEKAEKDEKNGFKDQDSSGEARRCREIIGNLCALCGADSHHI